MELVKVSAGYFQAKDAISARLPATIAPDVRERIIRMTEAISGTLQL